MLSLPDELLERMLYQLPKRPVGAEIAVERRTMNALRLTHPRFKASEDILFSKFGMVSVPIAPYQSCAA